MWYNIFSKTICKRGGKVDFKEEMEFFENTQSEHVYISKIDKVPILFTAAHTMTQIFEDGTTKLSEPYTKAICMYLNKYCIQR